MNRQFINFTVDIGYSQRNRYFFCFFETSVGVFKITGCIN